MEILVKVYNTEDLDLYYRKNVDGFIIGGPFSNLFNFTFEDIENIIAYCKRKCLDVYVWIDKLIEEKDKEDLYLYIDYLYKLDVNGIYFTDLAILDYCRTYNKVDKLIYNGDKLMCNLLDKQFFLLQGLKGVLISNELSLKELNEMLSSNVNNNDLVIGGHILLSSSRRKFMSNYFRESGLTYNVVGNENYTIREESRNYYMPIIEIENGTLIYSDYVLQMLDELPYLKNKITRGIIETKFENKDLLCDLITAYRALNTENFIEIKKQLLSNYLTTNFSSGYLYENVSSEKVENE